MDRSTGYDGQSSIKKNKLQNSIDISAGVEREEGDPRRLVTGENGERVMFLQ